MTTRSELIGSFLTDCRPGIVGFSLECYLEIVKGEKKRQATESFRNPVIFAETCWWVTFLGVVLAVSPRHGLACKG